MKYNFLEAIDLIENYGKIMRIEGTNKDVFFTDTYAYFPPDDCVVETGNSFVIGEEYSNSNHVDYHVVTFDYLKKMFQNKEWMEKEM